MMLVQPIDRAASVAPVGFGQSLHGLSLLLEDKRSKKNKDADGDALSETIEDRVERTCRAMAPFIPALISLGTSDLEADDAVEGLENTA